MLKLGLAVSVTVWQLDACPHGMSVLCDMLKICGPQKHPICGGNIVQKCSTPTTPSHSTGVRTHGRCHSAGNRMVEVTKPYRNRNTNIKIAVENANLCGKRYAICTLRWNAAITYSQKKTYLVVLLSPVATDGSVRTYSATCTLHSSFLSGCKFVIAVHIVTIKPSINVQIKWLSIAW